MIIVMFPLFFLAMYEKDGQPLEVIARHFIQTKFVRPKVRTYRTNNYYDVLMRQNQLEKEVKCMMFRKNTLNIDGSYDYDIFVSILPEL